MAKATSTYKNPVSQVFGMVLRKQRNISGKSSEEIAESIGIKPSFYRLVESGSNNLHISKALNLVDAFEGVLEFNAVSKILMSISIMEASAKKAIEEGAHYAEGLRISLEKLSVYDKEKLGILFRSLVESTLLNKLKQKKFGASESTALLVEMGLDVLMKEFLTAYGNFGQSSERIQSDYLLEFLRDVPTLYFDFLSETKESLLRMPVLIGFAGLWQWEERNRKNFKEMICISNHPASVVSIENLRRYKYKHLWEPTFKEAKFIFLTDKDADFLHQSFSKNLERSLEESNEGDKLKSLNTVTSKVSIKCLNLADEQSHSYGSVVKDLLCGEDFDKSSGKETQQYDAIWIFTMKNQNHVGFLASINYESKGANKNKLSQGISLTYGEVGEKHKGMKRLWETI